MNQQADLATLTAQPRPLIVGGRTYQVHPLTLADFGRLQAWVDAQQPDPFDQVNRAIARGSYSVAQQQHLLRVAVEVAARLRPQIGSPEADAMVRSVAGTQHVLYLSISKGDPAFTEADAAKLFAQLGPGHLARLFADSTADMVLSDPKA